MGALCSAGKRIEKKKSLIPRHPLPTVAAFFFPAGACSSLKNSPLIKQAAPRSTVITAAPCCVAVFPLFQTDLGEPREGKCITANHAAQVWNVPLRLVFFPRRWRRGVAKPTAPFAVVEPVSSIQLSPAPPVHWLKKQNKPNKNRPQHCVCRARLQKQETVQTVQKMPPPPIKGVGLRLCLALCLISMESFRTKA